MEEAGYLSRIVLVTDDVVEYRDWVARNWPSFSGPFIAQASQSPPTYASIANRHVQPETPDITSLDVINKSATWPLERSQLNVVTLMSANETVTVKEQEPLVRHTSADSLFTLASGTEMKVSANSVWSATSVRKLADSLAQDNKAKNRMSTETRSAYNLRHIKPPLTARPSSVSTSSSSTVTSYSGAIKQSLTSSLKQAVGTTAKASVVESSSKLKAVAVVGPISSGSPKKAEEQKTCASNNNNAVVSSPKLDCVTTSQLSKDNGMGKQSSPTIVLISKKNNDNSNQNNNNNNNNNNHHGKSFTNSGSKSSSKQKRGKSPKSKKGRS